MHTQADAEENLPLEQMLKQLQELTQPLTLSEKRLQAISLSMIVLKLSLNAADSMEKGRYEVANAELESAFDCNALRIAYQMEARA